VNILIKQINGKFNYIISRENSISGKSPVICKNINTVNYFDFECRIFYHLSIIQIIYEVRSDG
jgi:hypothetical protein